MNYFMGVPEDMIQSGFAEFYEDDDDTLIQAIQKYNDYETDCRIEYKLAERIIAQYCVINPILVIIIVILNAEYIFKGLFINILAVALLAVWAAVYFGFVLFKRRMLIGTLFTLPLVYLDLTFLTLAVFNAFLTFLYDKLDRPLRDNPTYPQFRKIDVKYRRGKRSEYHDPRARQ